MSSVQLTSEHRHESISFSCIIVSMVFFLVLSQALILRVPEIVTQIFRPVIILFLLIKMQKRGIAKSHMILIASLTATYEFLVMLLNPMTQDNLSSGIATILYLLMFCVVCGTPWNKRELKTIILSVFMGAFACAVVVVLSNNIADLTAAVNGDIYLFGVATNRNKNAYAFSIGTILGIIFIVKNVGFRKFVFFVMTIIIGFCLFYCQCRGAFFCTVAGVFVLAGFSILKTGNTDIGKALLYLLAFAALCIGVFFLIKNSAFSRLIDGESKSGRDDGIKYAFGLFKDYDLFGKIFGRGFDYEAAHTEGVGAHLVYATFLLSSGIIGAGLILTLFLSTGFRVKGIVPLALFTIAFLRTFFEGLDYYIYIPLVLSVIICDYSIKHRRNCSELFRKKHKQY